MARLIQQTTDCLTSDIITHLELWKDVLCHLELLCENLPVHVDRNIPVSQNGPGRDFKAARPHTLATTWHLPLARCTSHHTLPSMYVLNYGIIPDGAYTHYEAQFVDMKRPFCWIYADGVDIFLPVVLLSRQQGVTSVRQVRGESKPVERSHTA